MLKSTSVSVTVLIIYSKQMKVGNGNSDLPPEAGEFLLSIPNPSSGRQITNHLSTNGEHFEGGFVQVIFRAFLNLGLPSLWFACRSPFTKTMEITKTTKTTKTRQTATNKELSVGLAEITKTTEMTKTTGIRGAHGFPKQRV